MTPPVGLVNPTPEQRELPWAKWLARIPQSRIHSVVVYEAFIEINSLRAKLKQSDTEKTEVLGKVDIKENDATGEAEKAEAAANFNNTRA